MKRTLAEFEEGMTSAERRLADEIGLGGFVIFAPDGASDEDSQPPEDAGEDRTIRADFVRYLMLGGCDGLPKPVPETGVRIIGARVTGVLNLEGARCPRDLALAACRIEHAPVLRSGEIDGLFFDASHLPGLLADRLVVRGGVFLRGATVTGAVRLLGARIGGQLNCNNSKMTAPEAKAVLHCDGVVVEGDVFLEDATVTGAARLLGARIGGDLDCDDVTLIAGQAGRALDASRAEVTGSFFLRGKAKVRGRLDLTGARFGAINDAEACWPGEGDLVLDRCRYGAFVSAPTDAAARIRWLDLQDPKRVGEDFWPQPWEQCAKVLREGGHAEEAREVLIAKETRQRAAARARRRGPARWWRAAVDGTMWATTLYGRRPTVAFAWLIGFWLLGSVVFGVAGATGAIKPNSAIVLRSGEWTACSASYVGTRDAPVLWRRGETQVGCFMRQPSAMSYPTFTPWVYSLDTLLPVVAMEMQEFWIPDDRQGGAVARWYLWVHIIVGWALSLAAVAGFSGLIKTE